MIFTSTHATISLQDLGVLTQTSGVFLGVLNALQDTLKNLYAKHGVPTEEAGRTPIQLDEEDVANISAVINHIITEAISNDVDRVGPVIDRIEDAFLANAVDVDSPH